MKFSWISTLFIVLALSQMSPAQDACYSAQKKTATWGVTSVGTTDVLIPGVALKQIFVCSVVASGTSTGNSTISMNVDFEAGNSACTEVTQGFGDLFYLPNTTISVGGGGSTQFKVPPGETLCVAPGGAPPFFSVGWVTYVQK